MGNAESECKSVLLVDDNEVDAYLTCNVLYDCHPRLAVDLASTAEEALTKVRNQAYDLIVCDFCLPGMNGLSLLKLVKKMRSDMRVILLTAYPSQELEAQVIHHGSCTYLSKTVDAQTLCRIVKEALYPCEPATLSSTTGRSHLVQ
jgi:CheY-like chemotaxis protein